MKSKADKMNLKSPISSRKQDPSGNTPSYFTFTRTYKTMSIINIVTSVCYSIIILVLTCYGESLIPQKSPYLTEMVNNWNTDIITDIFVNITCPQNYTPIESYNYQGTNPGCNCLNATSNNVNKAINYGRCSDSDIAAGCQSIDPISSTVFTKFALNMTDKTGTAICIRKQNAVTWRNSALISPYRCPLGMIPCGNTNNYGSRICVDSTIGCPINQISVSTISTSDASSCQQDNTCAVLKTNPGGTASVMTWSTNADALPLVEFKFIENLICDFKAQDNITPNRLIYPLAINQMKPCYSQTDFPQSWLKLFTVSETSLFQYNNILTNVSKLPNISYYYTQTYNWNLYGRSYFNWDAPCRYYYFRTFFDKYDITANFSSVKAGDIAIIAITFVGFVLVIPMIFIFRIMRNQQKTITHVRTYLRNIKISVYIMLVAQLIVISIATTINNGNYNFFTDILSKNCLPPVPTSAIQSLKDNVNSLSAFTQVNIARLCLFSLFIVYQIIDHIILASFAKIPKFKTVPEEQFTKGDSKLGPIEYDEKSGTTAINYNLNRSSITDQSNILDMTPYYTKIKAKESPGDDIKIDDKIDD